MNNTPSDAYRLIDRFLRNNLGDDDYAEYSAALEEVLSTPQPVVREPINSATARAYASEEFGDAAEEAGFFAGVRWAEDAHGITQKGG